MIRLAVPDQAEHAGGLCLFGAETGRYQFDPTLVITTTDPLPRDLGVGPRPAAHCGNGCHPRGGPLGFVQSAAAGPASRETYFAPSPVSSQWGSASVTSMKRRIACAGIERPPS